MNKRSVLPHLIASCANALLRTGCGAEEGDRNPARSQTNAAAQPPRVPKIVLLGVGCTFFWFDKPPCPDVVHPSSQRRS